MQTQLSWWDYEYTWINGTLVAGTPHLLRELSRLYSDHYGRWSLLDKERAGNPVRLSADRLRPWLSENSKVALARLDGILIGYAIAVRAKLRGDCVISSFTQLLSHEDHRHNAVS